MIAPTPGAPDPADLFQSPELAVLAALDGALRAAAAALYAANPELLGDGPPARVAHPPQVWIADALVGRARDILADLERYRTAVRAAVEQDGWLGPDDGTSPF